MNEGKRAFQIVSGQGKAPIKRSIHGIYRLPEPREDIPEIYLLVEVPPNMSLLPSDPVREPQYPDSERCSDSELLSSVIAKSEMVLTALYHYLQILISILHFL